MEELFQQVANTQLEDERVFDDCDEIRNKIAAFIQRDGVSTAKFAQAIGITPPPINRFLSKKGWNEGGSSAGIYYFLRGIRAHETHVWDEMRTLTFSRLYGQEGPRTYDRKYL
jgi:hypothetical protein